MDARFYVESDGRIFLICRDGLLDLPFPNEVPFEVDRIAPLGCDEPVWFCVPSLSSHPWDWTRKDDVQTMDDVTPLVRAAVHATMPRVVVEGICLREGRVLLVKGNRGLTKDRWTLPGGFLQFGEDPRQGVLRELREEIGVESTIEELLDVRAKLGTHTRLHWTMLFYRVRIVGEPIPNPDEIAEVRFVDPDEALRLVADPLMCEAIQAAANTT